MKRFLPAAIAACLALPSSAQLRIEPAVGANISLPYTAHYGNLPIRMETSVHPVVSLGITATQKNGLYLGVRIGATRYGTNKTDGYRIGYVSSDFWQSDDDLANPAPPYTTGTTFGKEYGPHISTTGVSFEAQIGKEFGRGRDHLRLGVNGGLLYAMRSGDYNSSFDFHYSENTLGYIAGLEVQYRRQLSQKLSLIAGLSPRYVSASYKSQTVSGISIPAMVGVAIGR